MKFTELEIENSILSAIQKMGFEEMTPIQEKTIPLALEGKDVIGQAQTGTGKTVAFGIPTIQKIDPQAKHVQALVVAPTRELAIQTQEELFNLGRDKGIRVLPIYGGAKIGRQINSLKKNPHIVVGTPGRLLDHLNRKTLKLNQAHTVVLDEADEMLDMGFIEDIQKILSNVPKDRQSLLFSATMPKAILTLGERFMDNPEVVQVKSKNVTADNVTQYFTRASEGEKFNFLTRMIDVQAPEAAIIFGRTKRRVDEVARGLKIRGYDAEGIHGDLDQNKRMRVLNDFKQNKIEFLVATDVAARGLDISHVTHVYNYDIPQDPESYVHRIGRTGRAGKTGTAITFVSNNEMGYLKLIENQTKQQMQPLSPPSSQEVLEGQLNSVVEGLTDDIENGRLEEYYEKGGQLLSSFSADDIAAAYIKNTIQDSSEIPVSITPERPLPKKGFGNKGGKRKGKGGGGRGGRRRNNRRRGKGKNKGRR